MGHDTFILGRDKQNWHHRKFPLWKTVPIIFINLIKAKQLLAYIKGCEKSHGLTFELTLAKLLGKQITLVINKCSGTFDYDFEKQYATKVIELNSINELKERISHEF